MLSSKSVSELIAVSRRYGTEEYAVGGGGNTSVKDESVLMVKASGTSLRAADKETFVKLDRVLLAKLMAERYPEDAQEREAQVKRNLLRCRLEPELESRPSVEASLHDLIEYRFVVHTHAWRVNALTCSRDGRQVLEREFGDEALVLPYTDPGFVLAQLLAKNLEAYRKKHGAHPRIIFLLNHGLIVSADTTKEIDALTKDVLLRCSRYLPKMKAGRCATASTPNRVRMVNAIRSALSNDGRKTTRILSDNLSLSVCGDRQSFKRVSLPFTPDQIVYCKSHPLYVPVSPRNDADKAIQSFLKSLAAYRDKNGMDPRIVAVPELGIVALGDTAAEARLIGEVFADFTRTALATDGAGGPKPKSAQARSFIESWEVEKYRRAVAAAAGGGGARTAIVTGGAQGFGEGIVRNLFADGFNVVIADLNKKRGQALAGELQSGNAGKNDITFVRANVADEKSVSSLMDETVLSFGGCDLYVSNAGVLRAGGLDEIDAATFDFITSVNYKGYFIGVKYASEIMKNQHAFAPHLTSDIIQINSKSGLEGSNKNFTYAGGKFGGIGLTQSFALELMPFGIKVNSVCPGNFLDGPLWSDPKNGLFLQYLKAGKVPGAKTTADVRKAYESKVPAGRGCTVDDVMKAIRYIIEQEYETGQAVPVTGGQIMLR